MTINLTLNPIKNKPYIDFFDINGPKGNMIEIVQSFNNGMSKYGFKEECRYFASKHYFDPTRLNELKMSYDEILSFMHCFCISNLTYTTIHSESDDDYDYIVTKIPKFKNQLNDGINYMGRGPLFYAKEKDIHDLVHANPEDLLVIDNIGMSTLDHYLLTDKIVEAKIFIDYLLLNFSYTEYKPVVEAKSLTGQQFAKMLSKKNIDLSFTYHLLQNDYSNDVVDNFVNDIMLLIKKSNSNSDQLILDVIQTVEKNKYLKNDTNQIFFDSVVSGFIKNIKSPETKSYIEATLISSDTVDNIDKESQKLNRKMKI